MKAASDLAGALMKAASDLAGTPGWHIELVGGSRRQQRPAAADGGASGGGGVPPKQHHDAGERFGALVGICNARGGLRCGCF